MQAARIAAELLKVYGRPFYFVLTPLEGEIPPQVFLNEQKVYDGFEDLHLNFSQTRIAGIIKPQLEAALQAARARS